MTKRLMKTRKDHRQFRAMVTENTVTQTMTPTAGAISPGGTANVAYAGAQFALSAPVGTSRFSVASGSLPAGMVLSGAGALSGTPTVAGVSTFSVRGTDQMGNSVVNAYTLTVAA